MAYRSPYTSFNPRLSVPSRRCHSPGDFRCSGCGRLLGVCKEGLMHLRFTRGHEYVVGFPVMATCSFCGTLNRMATPVR